jgi:imidazole glycerol phosphate synthase glutamine amidotransferase subunit
MTGREVVVVRTGTANLASVLAAFRRLGTRPRLSEEPCDVESGELVVLPGVGTLAAAMDRLGARGLVEPLVERLLAGRATMAICLGLQLLCRESEESPDRPGLGVVPAKIGRFSSAVRVPQFGWNKVEPESGCRFVEPGYAYFANSFRLAEPVAGWKAATADHGGPFVAALEKDRILACQFHPELSGKWGLDLIDRWLNGVAESGGGPC